MSVHLTEQQIERYKGFGSSKELFDVDEHISECAQCRERLAGVWDVSAGLRGAEERARTRSAEFSVEHLTYDQLEGCVDGTMSHAEESTVRAHTAVCQECAGQLRDLEAFRDEREGALKHESASAKRLPSGLLFPWSTLLRVAAVLVFAVSIALVFKWEKGRGRESAISSSSGETRPPVSPVSPISDSLSATIATLEPGEQRAVREAMQRAMIPLPAALMGLSGGIEKLRGEPPNGPQLKVLEPVGEVVFDPQPVFRWQTLAGATTYSVSVVDEKGNLVLASPALHETQWKSRRPLQRSGLYKWQVVATMRDGATVVAPSPPSPEAKFRILDKTTASELEQFQQSHSDAHLVLGILYAQAGMMTTGERELKQIHQSDGNYELVQKLLKSIEEIRRR